MPMETRPWAKSSGDICEKVERNMKRAVSTPASNEPSVAASTFSMTMRKASVRPAWAFILAGSDSMAIRWAMVIPAATLVLATSSAAPIDACKKPGMNQYKSGFLLSSGQVAGSFNVVTIIAEVKEKDSMADAGQGFAPQDPDFEARGRASFARQTLMATLKAELLAVAPGRVEIAMPFGDHILQQHGFVHAAALTAIADTACGFAAMSLMPKGAGVLTTEFKVNLMSPAVGDRFIAVGQVLRAGRQLMVTLGECFAERDGTRKQVALMTATMMVMNTPGIVD